MYQMIDEIPFTRCGADGKLKISEAASMMMNCCQFQEYQEAEFCKFLRANNIAIFLFSIQTDIIRMPIFRDVVNTQVRIYGCKSIYGLRRITMRDQNGNLCLISNATGAFFDLNAAKAIKLAPDNMPIKFDEAEPMECLPRKIPIPSSGGIEQKQVTVRSSMLDINEHLTSHEYFAIASDILPQDFTYNRIRIEYKKQSKLNDIITPVLYLGEDKTAVVEMCGNDGTAFAAAEFSTADL